MNNICDKCKKREARHYLCSLCEPTISLCDECDTAYIKFMAEAKAKFFTDEIQATALDTAISKDETNSCGIDKIEIGDKVKCVNCDKPILLTEKTFIVDSKSEYIDCPHCDRRIDTIYYHIMGEKIKE